jgi:hypothetical protein
VTKRNDGWITILLNHHQHSNPAVDLIGLLDKDEMTF